MSPRVFPFFFFGGLWSTMTSRDNADVTSSLLDSTESKFVPPERFRACGLFAELDDPGSSQPSPGKRQRGSSTQACDGESRSSQALAMLQSNTDLAEAIFTEPCALHGSTQLGLKDVLEALPAGLHAVAAHGFFGAAALQWRIVLSDPASLLSARTAQLLSQQPRVTAVRLVGVPGKQHLELLSRIAHATHLTSLHIAGCSRREPPSEWLQRLAPLTRLQSQHVLGCQIASRSLPNYAPALSHLQQLTALELEGPDMYKTENDAGLAAFVPALSALTALRSLGLPRLRFMRAGASALQWVSC